MPLVFRAKKLCIHLYFDNSMTSSTSTVLGHVYAYKILKLLCRKILNIVHRADLENDLGKIYLWVLFYCITLFKKKIEKPYLTFNCISLDYTTKIVLS